MIVTEPLKGNAKFYIFSGLFAALICAVVWVLLQYVVPIDYPKILSLEESFEFYKMQKGMIGFWIFFFISVSIQFIVGWSIHHELPIFFKNKIDATQKYPWQLVILGIRLALFTYLVIYWYSYVLVYWISSQSFIFGVSTPFIIWPILFFLNSAIAFYCVVFEPWGFLKNSGRKKLTDSLMSFIRPVLYLTLYGLYALFASSKFPSDSSAMIISSLFFISLLIIFRSLKLIFENKR